MELRLLRQVLELLPANIAARLAAQEGESAGTPAAYEESGREFLAREMERRFGLRIVPGARVHRLNYEIPDAGDASMEWDFRAPVAVSNPPSHAMNAADMVIYPDRERYISPPGVECGRHLTPTKAPGSKALPTCDYIAIFEITTNENWPKPLLPRLEARLRITLDRARAHSPPEVGEQGILDVCGIIGIVTPHAKKDSVATRVKAETFPLLYAMMESGRFVCLRREFIVRSP
jgi:hypothetical protein